MEQHPLTERDQAMIRLSQEGKTVVEIGQQIGLKPNSVYMRLRNLGQQPITQGKRDRDQRNEQIRREFAGGASVGDLAQKFGLTENYVWVLTRRTPGPAKQPRLQERNEQIVTEIRAGEPLDDVARRYGLSPAYVRELCNGAGIRFRQFAVSRADWAGIDWTRQDIDIAEEYGVSRERVRQRRKQFGHPKPKRLKTASRRLVNWCRQNADLVRNLTPYEIRNLTGVDHPSYYVRQLLDGAGIAYAPTHRAVDLLTKETIPLMTRTTPFGCWEWQGKVLHGYPRCGPHYVAPICYRLWKGDIPPDQRVIRCCQNPKCVNPEHLVLGSISDSLKRPYGLTIKKVATVRQLLEQGKTDEVAQFKLPPDVLLKILRGDIRGTHPKS